MSRKILLVALTAFSVTAISGAAGATETGYDRDPIVREHSTVPGAPEYRFQEESLPRAFGGQSIENENSHVAKTGLWSGIKKVGSAVKSAGKAFAKGAKTAGTRVGSGFKDLAKDVANSKVGKTIGKYVKAGAAKVKSAAKAVLPFGKKK